tara:strand:+ start:684 stop:1028 length:345 start_codon:yes stop_codon:yes gene_type:complete
MLERVKSGNQEEEAKRVREIDDTKDKMKNVTIRQEEAVDLGKPLRDGVRQKNQDILHRQEDMKVCTVVRTFSGHGNGKSGLRHFLATWMGQQVRRRRTAVHGCELVLLYLLEGI